MRLRNTIRPPGRYREEDIEELPPNPRFVVPTIQYNLSLRPAVFPTLRWDELPPDHPSMADRRDRSEEHTSELQSPA